MINFSSRANRFKYLLIIEVVIIALYHLSIIDMKFYQNPFYLVGFILGGAIILMSLGYVCPHCQKQQIILGVYKFKFPKDKCHFCGNEIDSKESQ